MATASPTVSVVIPTFQRAERLTRCVDRLARQTSRDFELLIAIDGPDEASVRAARDAWSAGGGDPRALHVLPGEREGCNPARNRALAQARGRLLLSLNDDVIPESTLVEAHLRAHAEAASRWPSGVVISGYSPFVGYERATLFDVLCAETSLLFFYDQMIGPGARPEKDDRWHDWGFRHCYGLNFSAPLRPIVESGGFIAFPLAYGYDDIEVAWRLKRSHGMPVLFRPDALAQHDHRYVPTEVLDRERRQGAAAYRFAQRQPEFMRDLFKRDVASARERHYAREFVERERSTVARLEACFLLLGQTPASAIDTPQRATLLHVLSQQHVLLRRWYWFTGLLSVADAT